MKYCFPFLSATADTLTLYVATFVPVSTLLIIIIITGILCSIKRKRWAFKLDRFLHAANQTIMVWLLRVWRLKAAFLYACCKETFLCVELQFDFYFY